MTHGINQAFPETGPATIPPPPFLPMSGNMQVAAGSGGSRPCISVVSTRTALQEKANLVAR